MHLYTHKYIIEQLKTKSSEKYPEELTEEDNPSIIFTTIQTVNFVDLAVFLISSNWKTLSKS